MDIIGDMENKIQHIQPGVSVWHEETGEFLRVTEYPVITGQGVFLNLSGGQIGPLPLDSLVKVALWD